MQILSKLSNYDIISEFWMLRMSLGLRAKLWLQITTFFRIFHFVKSCEPNTILLNAITTYSSTTVFMAHNLTIKRRSYFYLWINVERLTRHCCCHQVRWVGFSYLYQLMHFCLHCHVICFFPLPFSWAFLNRQYGH